MSNKFKIILLRTAFMLLLIVSFDQLFAFAPIQKDFSSKYQYDLYRSWLRNGDFSTQKPAILSKDKISKTFGEDNEVTALYLLRNARIYDQQEPLSYLITAEETDRLQLIVDYLESFIYKLNAADSRFVFDLFSLQQFELRYKNMFGESAQNQLWNDFRNARIHLSPLEIELTSDQIIVSSKVSRINFITWIFPVDFDSVEIRREIEQMEEKNSHFLPLRTKLIIQDGMLLVDQEHAFKSKKTKPAESDRKTLLPLSAEIVQDSVGQEVESIVTEFEIRKKPIKSWVDTDTSFTPQIVPDIKTKPDVQFYVGMSIQEYLNQNLYADISRELLHNKILDPYDFLADEFKDYEIFVQNEMIHLQGKTLNDKFYSELKLRIESDDDGLNFLPFTDFVLEDKILNLSQNEAIDLSNLNDGEAEIVASRLPQLIYEHRSLGTDLLNFLLIHDNIPSTLVIQNNDRTIYEKESYAELLLLLNRYWNSCNVYFRIDNVKLVNGAVEMLAHLIANNTRTGQNDIAEVRFLLDDNYSINLIMMVLHPNAQI